MKIAASSGKSSKKVDLIIPLIEDEKEANKLTKGNSVTWEVRTLPTDNNSPTYKLSVRMLEGDETVRQMITWRMDVVKACVGLNATTLTSRRPIMEACMRTRPYTLFTQSLKAQAQEAYDAALKTALETDATAGDTTASTAVRNQGVDHYRDNGHLDKALGVVLLNLMPAKVLAKVKRQMRREMRKPVEMKVRAYCQYLVRLNQNDLPNLPPFKTGQELTQDELLDILLYGTPRSWQNEMDRQGFDPIEKGFYPTMEFMENLEGLEEKSLAQESSSTSKSKDKSKSKGKDGENSAKKKATHYCSHHGPNFSHNTSECRALTNKDKGKDGKFTNKTWTRKAEESASSSKKELAAFLAKSVQKQVKKELASIQKKKKRKSEDSDEEGECLLAEVLDGDLKGFNYDDMNNLKIDDVSDEVSV